MEIKIVDCNLDELCEFLPAQAETLIRLVGLTKAALILDYFGGASLRLDGPGCRDFLRLVEVAGADAAKCIATYTGTASPFLVPRCGTALKKVRNARLVSLFDQMTKHEKVSSRETIRVLVERFNLAERQVYRILKEPVSGKLMLTAEASIQFTGANATAVENQRGMEISSE